MENFIDQSYIENTLKAAEGKSRATLLEIVDRAARYENLSVEDVAALLKSDDDVVLAAIKKTAQQIKEHIYGNRIVMFAPLYVSDYCENRCAYCTFNVGNQYKRRKLTMDEIRREVEILEEMGHKRLALEAGEHSGMCPIEYILETIDTVYKMKTKNGEIRRLNVNIAATTVENYKKLHDAQIGTYILFQETYHKPSYEKVHLAGPKADYTYHLTAFDRAMEGGIEDVGGGVLFGFADPLFEVLGLMLHNKHLEEKFGVGFHTISIPRVCPADGIDPAVFSNIVDDETFKKVVAIIRLAVPFTGILLSTRESKEMRDELLQLGVSQLSAGSSTDVGGYALREKGEVHKAQFQGNDERSAYEIIEELLDSGYLPSFCTACYRSGRTGDRFMSLAKSGNIKNVCLPNALMTLKEYAQDYGDAKFQAASDAAIAREIEKIKNDKIRDLTRLNLVKIQDGERDFYV